MQILEVQQGTQEWLDNRLHAFNASEAPVMMGCHPNMKRDELLEAKATCNPKQYSDFVEKLIFAKGHETEAMARPILEAKLGEELYPVSGKNGYFQASFDGLTMDESIIFEHKQHSLELFEAVEAGDPPPYIYWQLEHQLLVNNDGEKVILVCSDGTAENWAEMEYTTVEGRRDKLLAGWKQFAEDLASFEPTEKVVEATGIRPDSLPSLFVDVSGKLTTTSNLVEFRQGAELLIGSIKTDLQTDEDFANADEAIKWLSDGEKKIDSAIEQAMSRTGPLEELVRTLKDVQQNLMRNTRLKLNKQVEAQKVNRRNQIVAQAEGKFGSFLDGVNGEFASVKVNVGNVRPDFYSAIKGKKSFDSMISACNDALAKAKIEVNEVAAKVRKNLALITEQKEYDFLFQNKQQLAFLESDHLDLTIKNKIAEYKQQQEASESARIQRHRNAIAGIEAAGEFGDDISLEALGNTKNRLLLINTSTMEEFAIKAEQSRSAVLAKLEARIEVLREQAAAKVEVKPEPHGRVVSSVSSEDRANYQVAGQKQKPRPTDSEIIEVLCDRFRVNEFTVIEWLQNMDLERETKKIAGNF